MYAISNVIIISIKVYIVVLIRLKVLNVLMVREYTMISTYNYFGNLKFPM